MGKWHFNMSEAGNAGSGFEPRSTWIKPVLLGNAASQIRK